MPPWRSRVRYSSSGSSGCWSRPACSRRARCKIDAISWWTPLFNLSMPFFPVFVSESCVRTAGVCQAASMTESSALEKDVDERVMVG